MTRDGVLLVGPLRGARLQTLGSACRVEPGSAAIADPRDDQGRPVWRLPRGAVMVPGFRDHHLHLLSCAARRASVDVSAPAARDAGAVIATIAAAAGSRPPGSWIRAWGYDDAFLAEGRDLTRRELDRASRDHPIVLRHRAGHVAVVNSAARELLVARAGASAVPADGIVVDRHDVLAHVPRLTDELLDAAAEQVSAELAAAGITAVTDATATNDRDAVRRLARLVAEGRVRQRVGAMVAAAQTPALTARGLRHGSAVGDVELLHAKLEVTAATEPGALRDTLGVCARTGWPAALHVTDLVDADLALDALEAVPPPRGTRHRIEHLALSLAEHVARLAACGAVVVTNPGFLGERGAKYRAQLSIDELAWLYRVRSLLRAGVAVLAGSDAPVTEPVALRAIARAVDRRGGGGVLAAHEAVAPADAMALFGDRTALAHGDLVVLSEDPARPHALARTEVLATLAAGRVVHAAAGVADDLPDVLLP